MSTITERVIYVDEQDREIGSGEKLEAHQRGILHRAVSVFLFNWKGELMLQKRAKAKYHSGGLWSNTCCGHPRPGEDKTVAARRKLKEEMSIVADVKWIQPLLYRTAFPNGLIENEYDHLFVAHSDKAPLLNPDEAEDWKWITPEALKKDMTAHPERYTYWLRLVLDDILTKLI